MTQVNENQAVEATETQEAAPAKKEKPTKVTIEKVTQNGITQPKDGSKTREVWNISDAISAKQGEPAPRKAVLDACEKAGINPATAATQYGKWRTFHGLVGANAPKNPVEPKEAKPKAEKKAKAAKAETAAPAPAPEAPAAPAPAPAAQAGAKVEIDDDGEV